MILTTVQQQFECLYQLPQHRTIEDFLINQEMLITLQAGWRQGPAPDQCRGMLLLSPQHDALGVAVYLDDRVLNNLAVHDPRSGLHANNLHDFCTMVEEVSHFLYVTWKAGNNRQMTRLELELQAEVDKFIFCSFYGAHQHNPGSGIPLKELLFETFTLQPHLPHESRKRYLTASKLALHYCHFLERRYMGKALLRRMLGEIRQFYRFGQADKISHINRSVLSH
jgi:hypothetical protein